MSEKRASDVIIETRGLTKHYLSGQERIQVLHGIDLEVRPGEMIAIMGPSGMGKSTLLFILGLLQPPSGGTYTIAGEDASHLNREQQAAFRRKFAGFVFQSLNLFEHTTVYENLEYPLIYAGVSSRKRPEQIRRALERVNMMHRINHPANFLSGGEQQRVSIARAMVNEPKILFADEPTGQLDRKHGRLVMEHFQEFVQSGDTAMVLVTHDPDVAALCTKTYQMRDGSLFEE